MAAHLRIVVVEDHAVLRASMLELLTRHGHLAIGVDSAEALTDDGAPWLPDLLILDVNLPGENGFSLARRIRETRPLVGIIMATARGEAPDRVTGYESGADIYLSKPWDAEELLAAIQAVARRLGGGDSGPAPASGQVSVMTHAQRLSGPAGTATLTPQEVSILSALATAPGRQLETWQLMQVMGEDPATYTKAALEVRLTRLRQKLARVGLHDQTIPSVRNVGYRLLPSLVIV